MAAIIPVFANITVSQINEILALLSTVAGLAFLIWRWRKAHKRYKLTGNVDTIPPIPPR